MVLCAGCGKPLSGAYVAALERAWHPGCFVCAGCGRAIGGGAFLAHEGRPYHEGCYRERYSPRCAGCGQPIDGPYVQALGQDWHAQHFTCARCGSPLGAPGFVERACRAYCEECYHAQFSPRCAVCGEPMRGRYVTDVWNDAYCARHEDELPHCYGCGRPLCERLTGGGVVYADGRITCSLCRGSAVDRPEEGAALLADIRRALATQGVDLGAAAIPLRLVDQDELRRLSAEPHAPVPAGLARTLTSSAAGRVLAREVQELLVLHGLPRELFGAVAAHELGHAWLFLHDFPALPPLAEEGLCELFASLWLAGRATPEAAARLRLMQNNIAPIYGDGYRAARAGLEKLGLAALLAYVRTRGTLPTVRC